MSSAETLVEKKTGILIKIRGYKIIKKEEIKNAISYKIKTKNGDKGILWAVTTDGTVGVAYITQLKKTLEDAKVDIGIITTVGKYTHTAKSRSKLFGIELIPKIFPSFKIITLTFLAPMSIPAVINFIPPILLRESP